MALLIDTSVFIALERLGRPLSALASVAPDEPSALAAITASELLAGVNSADSIERRTRREAFVEALLDMLAVIPFDLLAARIHAQIWTQLTASGKIIGAHDLLIASTAIAHGYAVLTNNVREFHRVSGLEVRQLRW